MLANVRRLLERREAHTSHSWGNPEAKTRSRATVGSRVAGFTLDGEENEGGPTHDAERPKVGTRSAVWLSNFVPAVSETGNSNDDSCNRHFRELLLQAVGSSGERFFVAGENELFGLTSDQFVHRSNLLWFYRLWR
jgi:hypothetical protein